ncbi:YhcG family protein [Runella sp.]|uniref:PDDEXK nuclease domain-containing protein n=1 Tax=Runella sp. TaxID=1960881 RepID=UPI00262EFB39|nr:PDDEXK nuclease domain-containing protein [Runella sp.]
MNEINYLSFIQEVKEHIVRSRYIAARLVNREQLLLYFLVGKRLSEKVAAEKWGAKVIEQIAADLQKELPGLRGFSFTNLKNMRQFADEYSSNALLELITVKVQGVENESIINSQLTTGQFEGLTPDLFFGIGFTQHILLLNKCKIWQERLFYMTRTVENHWTGEMLEWQIKTQLYQKQGKTIQNNFGKTLSPALQQSSTLAFKDEYLLDYINIETDDERVVEKGIVNNIKEFIMRMGKGFSFIGNQHRLVVDEDEFYIDLLFYNRILKCLVAFELKKGKFRPQDAGQLNFYLNVLNDIERLPEENPAIGIVLCSAKNDKTVEYAFQQISNPMGVAVYQLSERLPEHLKNVLPDAESLKKLLD